MIKQNWWQLTSIQIGAIVCLPALMIGQELFKTYGFEKAIIAIIIGNVFLFVLSLIKARMCYENKAPTIENATQCFGHKGTFLLANILIITLLSWFGIQLNLISLSVQNSFNTLFGNNLINITLLNLILGSIITLGALRGIAGLNKLADFSMPVLLLTIGYAIYRAYNANIQLQMSPIENSYKGISLVIAASIMMVIDLPTYYRFSKSLKESITSLFLIFVLALPAIELAGGYISMHTEKTNLIDVLTAHGNSLYQLWILLFLILAGWTTNNANLYSAAITLKKLLPKTSQAMATFIIGILGTVLSCLNLLGHLEETLNSMGILISSMGAVIATDYLITKVNVKTNNFLNIIACTLGSIYGFISFFRISGITNFEIIDAFIVSCCATIFLNGIMNWKNNEKNN